MFRTALYVRVSTLGQEEDGYSIDEQIDRLTKYTESRGWQVAKVYKDSQTGSNMNRPGLQALIRDVKNYDSVVVYKLDRLSRSQKEVLYIIEDIFEKHNTNFVSLMENFDTSTPFGKAMIGILAVFAQLEREQIKERVALGKLGRVKSGKPSSWIKAGFGYIYSGDTLTIDPIASIIVKQIFKFYLSGVSITKITNILNDEGHIGKVKKWSHTTVKHILTNPTYAGYVPYKGELFDGNHEALVSIEDFEKTQAQFKRRQKEAYTRQKTTRPFQSKYLLSGLLYCPCGSHFGIHQGNLRKDGTRYKKYICYSKLSPTGNQFVNNRNPEGCNAIRYEIKNLEGLVLDEIEKIRLNPEGLVEKDINTNLDEKTVLKRELSTLNDKLGRIVTLYIEGNIPIDMLNRQREELEEQQKGIQLRLDKLNQNQPDLPVVDARILLASILKDIRTMKYEEQKKIVRALIEKISLEGEAIRIKWRFHS